ncbi:MAG: sugar ABC transporter permease [Clostridia bacterium]|nr:sugar ABC transporter permease [Clostridia bacterium]
MKKKEEIIVLKQKKSFSTNLAHYWPFYLMVLPGIIYLIIFKYTPMAGSIIAFQDYSVSRGLLNSTFVGLKHFKKLFTYPDFWRVFRNTFLLSFLKLIFMFPIPVILALMLDEVRVKSIKKTVQTIICVPHFISWVVVGGLVFEVLGSGGIFNSIRGMMGLEPILIMQKETWFRGVFVVSSIWKDAGWGTIVYLAAISGIDPSLYESAVIDGASRFQRVKYITIRILIPTVVTLSLLEMGKFMELGFNQVSNLYTPMTYSVADIFDTYVYRTGILNAKYSFSTAVGLFQSVVGFVLVSTFNRLSNKYTEEGGLW